MKSTPRTKVERQQSTSERPEGWTTAELTEVCELNPGKPKADSLMAETEVSFVPMVAVDADLGVIAAPVVRSYASVSKGFTAFQNGDVILAKITPCMENGKAAIARNLVNGVGFGSTEFHVFRPSVAALPDYIFYFIRQESFRKSAEANMTGSVGQKRVPVSFLNKVNFPLPPLNEQRRIVAKLEKLLSRVDAARARLANIPRLLKRFRQSVLAAACSGKLTADWREENPHDAIASSFFESRNLDNGDESPNTWAITCVGDVIDGLKYGTSQKCSYEKRGVPVLRIPNIGEGIIETADIKYAELPQREFEQLKLSAGDILLIRSNGSVSLVGKSALISESENGFAYAGYLIRLKPDRSRVTPKFLNLTLSSHSVRLQIEVPARSTSGVNNINSNEVRALEMALPPLAEQQEIVRRVETLFKTADTIEARYRAAKAQVDKLTQSILARAFRGELVTPEAELARREGRDFEPAAVLLERVRQERSAPAAAPKRKSTAKRTATEQPRA